MADELKIHSVVSRRLLLLRTVSMAGATAILGVTANEAAAAKMAKKAVVYQDRPKGKLRCDNCALFEAPNACRSVEGVISPQGWCDIYVKK